MPHAHADEDKSADYSSSPLNHEESVEKNRNGHEFNHWKPEQNDQISPHQALLSVCGRPKPETATGLHETEHNMDVLLTNLGSPGRYQLMIFAALISCMFPVVFNDLCTIFYTVQPVSSLCQVSMLDPGTGTIYPILMNETDTRGRGLLTSQPDVIAQTLILDYTNESSCAAFDGLNGQESQRCELTMEHTFEDPLFWSIVGEWNLVCGSFWLVNFATTIYFVGVMVGSMAYGHLADQFGRKRCIDSCYLGYIPLAIALAYVPYYWLFLVLRFFIGFFIQGLQSICFVLLMEYCAPTYREILGGFQGSLNNFGIMVLSGAAYWWKDWRKIQLCITIPTLLALTKIIFLRESLRWQMVHGRLEEAKETIYKILQWNRMPISPRIELSLEAMSAKLQAEQQLQSKYSWIDCFRTPRIRRYTIVQSFIWFTTLFVYYGISFSIGKLSGNIHLNTISAAAAEIPAAGLAVFFMRRFGRRKPLMVYYAGCGIFCILAGFLSLAAAVSQWNVDFATMRTVSVFIARFFLAGTFTIVMVFGSELFPTVIRNTAFGICICCHTAGGVVAPQVLLLGHLIHDAVPFLVFGGCCILAAILVMSQPETLNRKMPDTIEQVEGAPRAKHDGESLAESLTETVPMVPFVT